MLLITADPLTLATELSDEFIEIAAQKREFEAATRQYIALAESDAVLKQKGNLVVLAKGRGERLKVLIENVRIIVETKLVEADRDLSEASHHRYQLQTKLAALNREIQFTHSLTSAKPELKRTIRQELLFQSEVAKSELLELGTLR